VVAVVANPSNRESIVTQAMKNFTPQFGSQDLIQFRMI